jgi:signal transduction histidine kinase
VRELIGDLEVLVAPQLQAKRIAYTYHPCDPTLRVVADAERTQQVVLNLLSNALKYTPPGGGVTLGCEAVDGRVLVRVRDTGIGIPRDKLEMIFEPFTQVSGGLTRSVEGTGLGLAISRELARAMGGELTVESEVGVGSTFTLALPKA